MNLPKTATMHFWVKMGIGTQMIPFTPNGIRIQFWEKLNGKRKNHTRITETRLDNPKIADLMEKTKIFSE